MEIHRGADKSLDRSGRKQATATENIDFHIIIIIIIIIIYYWYSALGPV